MWLSTFLFSCSVPEPDSTTCFDVCTPDSSFRVDQVVCLVLFCHSTFFSRCLSDFLASYSVLERDLYHLACMPIHLVAALSPNQKNELFLWCSSFVLLNNVFEQLPLLLQRARTRPLSPSVHAHTPGCRIGTEAQERAVPVSPQVGARVPPESHRLVCGRLLLLLHTQLRLCEALLCVSLSRVSSSDF